MYHLLDGISSAHEEASLQLQSAVSGLELIGVGWSLHVEIGSLVILDLPDVIPDFFGLHYFSDPPTLNHSTKSGDYVVFPSREIEGLVNKERSDALADEPPTEDFLDFCRTLIDIEFQHMLSHRFYMDKALAETP